MNTHENGVVSTGNAELDSILHGGFPSNSINIIMGEPGTGKTLFAEQLVFHHATDDNRPVLYLTTLAEPLAKVLTYLQRFTFFDVEKIGKSVHYEDLGFALTRDGLPALHKRIKTAIHDISPKIIVIDSFRALHDLADSPRLMRNMLYEVTSMLAAYETTVFLVGEYTEEDLRAMPEFAIADGILQFLRQPLSTRDERFVRVLKLRGSGYREGLHGLRICAEGLEVFPRLVTPDFPAGYELKGKRVSSGIPGLDGLISGGFVAGSTALVAGSSGSGKTTFALQFLLDGIKKGRPGLFINFQENPTQMAGTIASLGYDINDLIEKGLRLFYMSPVELQIDSIIVKVFKSIAENNIQNIAIDAIGDIITAAGESGRIHDYLYALNQHLSVSGLTTLMTLETPGGITGGQIISERFSYMSDAIILLNQLTEGCTERTLSVLKQRGSAHAMGNHRFNISEQGLQVI